MIALVEMTKKKNFPRDQISFPDVTYSDFAHFRESIGPELIYDRQQHLVTGDLTKVDP